MNATRSPSTELQHAGLASARSMAEIVTALCHAKARIDGLGHHWQALSIISSPPVRTWSLWAAK